MADIELYPAENATYFQGKPPVLRRCSAPERHNERLGEDRLFHSFASIRRSVLNFFKNS
jgi:hypothetical protein